MEYSKAFGESVKAERIKRNFSVEMTASMIGKTPDELEKIEKGEFEELDNGILSLLSLFSMSFDDAVFGLKLSESDKKTEDILKKSKIEEILSFNNDEGMIQALKIILDRRKH